MRNLQQKSSPAPVEVDDTMNEPVSKSRFAIDLEDLERQLKVPPTPARGGDALAELARIVGRDDPLKGLFAHRQTPSASAPMPPASLRPSQQSSHGVEQRIEPSFEPSGEEQERPNLRGALDEFDALLRRDLGSRGQPPMRQDPTMSPTQSPTMSPSAYEPPVDEPSADEPPAAMHVAPEHRIHARLQEEPAVEAAEIPAYSEPPAYQATTRAEPIIMDRFIEELEQSGRHGVDMPHSVPHDERRAPHDLDEPRDIGRPGRAPTDDQLSRDLDEQVSAYPLPPTEDLDDLRPLTPRRSRKGLISIVALLGVAAVGVVVATTYRPMPKAATGEPPVIKAETGPNKIAPQSPGGTEVPNQNKQIYERTGETRAADTKVVSREEQPVDVQQAARTAARVILPGGSAPAPAAADAAAAPAAGAAPNAAAPVPGLGEPRRVRTVSIRPDGTVASPNGAAAAPAGTTPAPSSGVTASALPPGRTSPVPTLVLPQAAAGPQPPVRPVLPVSRPTTPRVAAPEDAAADAGSPVRLNSNALARPKVQDRITDRVASAPTPASAPAVPVPASEAPVPGGGFAVQLGAPGSEAEARSTFAALQRKYPGELGGQSPLIRKADVNGREVYRLRVGPLSRDGATSLCTRLKSAGGNCFIARN